MANMKSDLNCVARADMHATGNDMQKFQSAGHMWPEVGTWKMSRAPTGVPLTK